MLYVLPLIFFYSFPLVLMFSLIFMNMQIRYFVYHTTWLKCNFSVLFGNKFGSLEKLSADI